MAYFALKHLRDDIKQLIEQALGRLGHLSLREGGETRANLLLLEPASARERETARRVREVSPDLPIVSVSTSPALPEGTRAAPGRPPRRTVPVAGLNAMVESLLNADAHDLLA